MAVNIRVNARTTGTPGVAALQNRIQSLGASATAAGAQVTGLQAAVAASASTVAFAGRRIAGLRTAFLSLLNPISLVSAGLIGVGGIFGALVIRNAIRLGNDVERLRISFRAFFGDAQRGEQAFNFIRDYAATVPFAFQEIQRGASNLAVTAAGDVNRFNELLSITGNVAAVAGIGFEEAGLQIQRALSGGIGAADLLRDRGIRAVLGFQAGVMVSVEETAEAFDRVFGPGGRFGNITNELARTVVGITSLIGDRFDQVFIRLNETLFPELFRQFSAFNRHLGDNEEALNRFADRLGTGLVRAFRRVIRVGQFVVNNFDDILTVLQSIILLRVGAFFAGLAANLVLVASNLVGIAIALGRVGVVLIAQVIPAFGRLLLFLIPGLRTVVTGTLAFAAAIGGRLVLALRTFTTAALLSAGRLLLNPVFALIAAGSAATLAITGVFGRIRDGLADLAREASEGFDESSIGKFLEGNLSVDGITNIALEGGRRLTQGLTAGFTPEALLQKLRGINSQVSDALFGDIFDGIDNNINVGSQIPDRNRGQIGSIDEARDAAAAAAEAERRLRVQTVLANAALQDQFEDLRNINREAARGNVIGEGISVSTAVIRESVANNGIIENIRMQEEAWQGVLNAVRQIGDGIADNLVDSISTGMSLFDSLRASAVGAINDIARALLRSGINRLLTGGLEGLRGGGGGNILQGVFQGARRIFGFQNGGIVPGGAPFTDRVPALLTPGERVIPRDEVGSMGGVTNINNTINVSGNVDQRAIDQIRNVISTSYEQVGSASRVFNDNNMTLRGGQ